jgi:hypothetical protein
LQSCSSMNLRTRNSYANALQPHTRNSNEILSCEPREVVAGFMTLAAGGVR